MPAADAEGTFVFVRLVFVRLVFVRERRLGHNPSVFKRRTGLAAAVAFFAVALLAIAIAVLSVRCRCS